MVCYSWPITGQTIDFVLKPVVGAMLGINMENLVSGGTSKDTLRLPSTFFTNMNIKKEPQQELPPPVPVLDVENKDSSVSSDVIEQSPFELGEYVCSPPSSPLRVTLRKVHNKSSAKEVNIPIPGTETLLVTESSSTPRSDVQEPQLQPTAAIADQISVDSDD